VDQESLVKLLADTDEAGSARWAALLNGAALVARVGIARAEGGTLS
jgi:hypothetical protein